MSDTAHIIRRVKLLGFDSATVDTVTQYYLGTLDAKSKEAVQPLITFIESILDERTYTS